MYARFATALLAAGLAATPALAGEYLSWPAKVRAYGYEQSVSGFSYESYSQSVSVSEYSSQSGGFEAAHGGRYGPPPAAREAWSHASGYAQEPEGLAGGPPGPGPSPRYGYGDAYAEGAAYAQRHRYASHGHGRGAGYAPARVRPPCPHAGGERVVRCVYIPRHEEVRIDVGIFDGGVGVIPSGGGGGGGVVLVSGMPSAGARAFSGAFASASARVTIRGGGGGKAGGCHRCGGGHFGKGGKR